MPKKSPPNPNGKKGNPLSLAPLTADQALAAALRVNPDDVKKLEAADKALSVEQMPLSSIILAHLRDLGFTVTVNRAAGWVGMTAVGADGRTHVARIDEDGAEAEERAAVLLAKSVGVDLEDG